MSYSFQTFSFQQVLTSAQMDQVEVNVRDHVHGQDGVGGEAVEIIQSISKVIPAATGSTTFPNDDTTPLSSEGTEIVSQAITPADNTNKIHLTASVTVEHSGGEVIAIVAFRGSTAIGAATVEDNNAGNKLVISLNLLDSPASASAQTYSLRIGSLAAQTWYANRHSTEVFNGEMAKNAMTLQEIVA